MSESDSTVPTGFRVIPGFPRYAIDENGTVLSVSACGGGHRKPRHWKNAIRIACIKDKSGYHRVDIYHDGYSKRISVHTLVLLMFVGPCPDGMECRHIDGNRANNHVSNLAWGTRSENQRDRFLHGTSSLGENNGLSKLTASDVLEIRRRAANGETHIAIAKDFSVNRANISHIVRRLTWKHI